MNSTLIIIIIAAAVIAALSAFLYIRRRIAKSPTAALLRYAARSVKNGDINDRLSFTPKSLSSMDKIFLPQILKDFPEFNWNEFKPLIQSAICGMLRAIDERDVRLTGGNQKLKDAVSQILTGTQIPHYKDVKVHDTVIKRYFRQEGTCCILCESAVEYYTYIEENGRVISGYKDRKRQEVYETELVYIQDPALAGKAVPSVSERTVTSSGKDRFSADGAFPKAPAIAAGASGLGLTCPNCGAPVTSLGTKRCEYCGSAIEPLNIRVWQINSIRLN